MALDLHLGQFSRRFGWAQNSGLLTVSGVGRADALTLAGTASLLEDATGQYISLASAATTDTEGGVVAPTFDWFSRQVLPEFDAVVKTGASILVQRIWIGLVSGDPMALADPAGLHIAAFRYDTVADGTAFWRTVTKDGTTATVTVTTRSIAADTRYLLEISLQVANEVRFLINGLLVATHTANLPGNTTVLGGVAKVRTLETVAKSLRFSRLGSEHL